MAMALRAPQRCFLGDVSRCIVDHWQHQQQQQQQEQEGGSVLCDEPRTSQNHLPLSLHQQSLTLRMLGTVVNLITTTSQSTTATLGNRDFVNAIVTTPIDYVLIVLDDGTGLVSIHAPQTMVAQIRVQVGTTLECIARLHCKGTTCSSASTPGGCTISESRRTNVDDAGYSLIADQLVVVQDAHMESLRWLELCYRKKLQSWRAQSTTHTAAFETSSTVSSDADAPLMSMEWGFPTRSSITADDVFRIIVSDCHAYVPAPATVTPKSAGPTKQRPHERMVQQPPMGVSIEDLAECLSLSRERVQELIQELQSNCQIYCNEHGLFVPL
jgi:hypothetical protein